MSGDYPRSRSMTENQSRSYLTTVRKNKYGVEQSRSTEAMAYLGRWKDITDWAHPGFVERQKMGELFCDEFQLTKMERKVIEGGISFPDGDSRFEITGDLTTPWGSGNPPNISAERNSRKERAFALAAISASKKLNTAQVEMGENLATLGQTVSMLRRPFASSRDILGRMMKRRDDLMGRRKRKLDIVQASSQAWLEQSFGFRQVFQDIDNILSGFNRKCELLDSAVRVARSASVYSLSDEEGTSVVFGGENIVSGLVADQNCQVYCTGKVGCGIYYILPSNINTADLEARRLGLGVNNLPVTGWNLIPYSWIADQIVGVGDWLQAMNPDPDLIILAKWRTDKVCTTTTQTARLKIYRAEGTGSPSWHYGTSGEIIVTSDDIKRVIQWDLPLSPQFNPYLGGIAQVANDFAFGAQNLAKLVRKFMS